MSDQQNPFQPGYVPQQAQPGQPPQQGQPGQPPQQAQPVQPGYAPQQQPAQTSPPGYAPQSGQPGYPDQHGFAAQQQKAYAQQPVAPTYPFRLLAGETVLASYPITSISRPLGKLASALFITSTRVVYAAEGKSVFSSSTDIREFQLGAVEGISINRQRGLNAFTVGIAGAVVLNLLGMLILGAVVFGLMSQVADAAVLIPVTFVLIIVSGLVGFVVIMMLRRPVADIDIISHTHLIPLGNKFDLLKYVLVLFFVVVFGPFALLLALVWLAARALGVMNASDAPFYVTSQNVDVISHDAGTVLLEARAQLN